MLKFWRNPVYVIFCATTVILLSYGMRQSFGLFMQPISESLGWGRESLSFALAIQNLMIGLAAPFVGALADKHGPLKVVGTAGAIYAAGLYFMSLSTTPEAMLLSGGVLAGLGVSGCGLSLMLSIVGRVAPENKRSLWLGITTAGGTAGQLVIVPSSQLLISTFGWVESLVIMAGVAGLIVPLAASLSGVTREALTRKDQQTLSQALREAGGRGSYWLVVTGFFVCGFQVQFVAAHLPAYLVDQGIDASMGATAIAVIGLFNMLGTWTAGWLGGFMRKKHVLALLYLGRSIVIATFILVPISNLTVVLFAAALGMLWLSTVPLTSGIVAQMFGVRYMATLFGIVFMSHQLGSFSGVWLGGLIFDATGSYRLFWWLAVAMGLVAALLNWPVDDRPSARIAAGQKA